MSGPRWRPPSDGERWAKIRTRLLGAAAISLILALTGFSVPEERATAPPRALRAPRHISLLIGVGNYEHASTKPWRDLHLRNLAAPSTDVLLMKRVLRNRGFPQGPDQLVLVDRQASKDRIRQAFEWVASRATDSSDVVVIYYSGHGSWAPDQKIDGVRKLDEALSTPGDDFDEALIPWDAREPNNARQLVLDDEIGAWLARIRTGNVTMIVDACFSGTITRGSPEDDPSAPVARGPTSPAQPRPLGASSGLLESGRRLNHILLTAAAAYEKAIEKTFNRGTVTSGVFTRALVEAIEGASPDVRFDEVMQTVYATIGALQTPQLEGDGSVRLFRVGTDVVIPARGYAIVVPAHQRHVGIDVGAIHGVRKGMLYDVYGPGETSFRGPSLRQVRVDSVFEASSFAEILPGTGTIPASAVAVLSRVPRGAMALDRLRLFVDPSASALRDSLSRIEWLQLTDRSPTATLRRRGNAYQLLVGGQLIPPLARDDTGGLTAPVAGAVRGYKGSLRALCGPLSRAYSISAMNLVSNSQPPPPSRLRLDVRVLRVGEHPEGRPRSIEDTVRLDDRIQIWVRVDIPPATVPHSPLYLSVAVAGYTTAPAVLWPSDNDSPPRLTAQQINQWVPVLVRPVRVTLPTGIEHIKAVISSDAFDLRQLVNSLPDCTTPRASRGSATRGPTSDLVVTGWTAFHRRVEILPRS